MSSIWRLQRNVIIIYLPPTQILPTWIFIPHQPIHKRLGVPFLNTTTLRTIYQNFDLETLKIQIIRIKIACVFVIDISTFRLFITLYTGEV